MSGHNNSQHKHTLLENLKTDCVWQPQALETLTNVLKHYATSVGNNPDKWIELAKCLISGLPAVNGQAFNALKELSKAQEDLEKTRAQLEQRKKEHKDLQSRLREPTGNTSELLAKVIKAQQQVAELQDELKRQEAQCKELEGQLNSMSARVEETSLRERCIELEGENEVLRKELTMLKSRSTCQFCTPPPVRVIAEGDNEGGPTGSKQVDQAKSAFKPARRFPEEPTRNSQSCSANEDWLCFPAALRFWGRTTLVNQEVPMHRQRSHIGVASNQIVPQPAAQPPGGAAGPSRADQVDQASSAFKPTQLSFEEPIGDAQGRSPLVEHEVAMQRQRSPVDNQSDEEMSLRARCKELQEENGALRKELEELKSRSRPQVFTVDQARSAFRPTRLFPEEPTGNAQTRLVEQEVAMHRHRSPVSNQGRPRLMDQEVAMQHWRSSVNNQTPPQPAAQPPGGAAGPSRADQGGEETRLRARCKELEGEKEELRKQLEESRSFQQPSTSDEETRLRARCKELEEEIEALRRQPAESRSLQQPSTPPPARAVAEGDNVAGPSGIKQASPSSITPDRSSDRTIPASQFPPPSIDEFGRLSKAELEAKITKLTQRGCVLALRYAGILTKCPNRDPGDDLVKAQLFEIAGWLLPDTSLPGSIADLVKLLKNKGKMTDGGQDVIGSRELVQAAYDKYPAKLAPAIQLVPWEYTHLHIQGLKNLLIRLGVDEVREANDRNKSFPQPYLRQKANELTGAALAAPAS